MVVAAWCCRLISRRLAVPLTKDWMRTAASMAWQKSRRTAAARTEDWIVVVDSLSNAQAGSFTLEVK